MRAIGADGAAGAGVGGVGMLTTTGAGEPAEDPGMRTAPTSLMRPRAGGVTMPVESGWVAARGRTPVPNLEVGTCAISPATAAPPAILRRPVTRRPRPVRPITPATAHGSGRTGVAGVPARRAGTGVTGRASTRTGSLSGSTESRAAPTTIVWLPTVTIPEATRCRRAAFTTSTSRPAEIQAAGGQGRLTDHHPSGGHVGAVGAPPVFIVEEVDQGPTVDVRLEGGEKRPDLRRFLDARFQGAPVGRGGGRCLPRRGLENGGLGGSSVADGHAHREQARGHTSPDERRPEQQPRLRHRFLLGGR